MWKILNHLRSSTNNVDLFQMIAASNSIQPTEVLLIKIVTGFLRYPCMLISQLYEYHYGQFKYCFKTQLVTFGCQYLFAQLNNCAKNAKKQFRCVNRKQ